MDRPTTLAVASLVFLAWWSAAAAFSTIGTYPPGNHVPRLLHSVSFWNKGSATAKLSEGERVSSWPPVASSGMRSGGSGLEGLGFGSWWGVKFSLADLLELLFFLMVF